MSVIDNLEPADKMDVGVYLPYYPNKDKQKILPLALSLYQKGSVEGQRRIEGGSGISFVATWYVSKLPSELTRCRMQFEGQADLSYEMTVLNSEFIDYLIDLISIHNESKGQFVDFPQNFYKKLLRFDESPSLRA
ncbi:type IV pilus biogenesis protein EbsA [Synechocystis sp. LKSZ1]|uniref:type IV pilus biogenesis protein EbsA n=1 Tax=Synechocystis sp. LKSZ1 TaxID=3144951 RepID=UPI00336C0DCD